MTARRMGIGLALAVASAMAFGLSGSLARGLLDAGWSPGAVVLARLAIAALVVAPIAARALRGRWGALRANSGSCSSSARCRSPARSSRTSRRCSGWTWASAADRVHGARRRGGLALVAPRRAPGPLTVAGAGLAALGLVLVLDLLSGADLAPVGVLWALIAMVGAASYFVLAAKPRADLPPVALAGAGLATGAFVLAALGAVGILPMHATTASPVYADNAVRWWLPLLGLGVVTAGLAYCTGIAASRRLGSRWPRSSRCSRSSPA